MCTHAMGKVGWVGLEPTTNALKGRCSTIELPTREEKHSGVATDKYQTVARPPFTRCFRSPAEQCLPKFRVRLCRYLRDRCDRKQFV
jgi:hypothetical protein